jgi:hypothetical protein
MEQSVLLRSELEREVAAWDASVKLIGSALGQRAQISHANGVVSSPNNLTISAHRSILREHQDKVARKIHRCLDQELRPTFRNVHETAFAEVVPIWVDQFRLPLQITAGCGAFSFRQQGQPP